MDRQKIDALEERQKREKWARLKEKHPEFSDDLVKISQAFGKLKSVLVMSDDGKWLRVK
jgi:hypothetical protein